MQHGVNKLLLASSSFSRQKLLRECGIPFELIQQDADESACDWGMAIEKVVASIARHKMDHAQIPHGKEVGQVAYVLTADTLTKDVHGTLCGKPQSREEAIAMIKTAREGSSVCTAFCLDKREWDGAEWQIVRRIERDDRADLLFSIPDEWIGTYFANSIGLKVSSAIAIEEFGQQFLRSVNGSYSTIVGLPMPELRESLHELGFFSL